MNAPRLTDAQVSQALRAHLPDGAQAGLRERILEAAETTGQQRALPSFLGALSEADPVTRRRSLLIAAALLVALALAATAAVGALRSLERDPLQDLSLEPEETPRPEPTPLPTSTPKATARPSPSGPVGPLAWTPASLDEDWPAPVRAEPAGGAILEPILVIAIPGDSESCCLTKEPGRYIDPTGDTGSDVVPWLDISEIRVGTYRVTIIPASNQTPDVDPTERWIAYGIVFDDDRDGVPDRRFGIDNVRTWMTDLRSGRTVVADGDAIGGAYLSTISPAKRGAAVFSFGGDTPGGPKGMRLDNRPFYVWASVIENGRVVATDYAPDFGWLDTSLETKP